MHNVVTTAKRQRNWDDFDFDNSLNINAPSSSTLISPGCQFPLVCQIMRHAVARKPNVLYCDLKNEVRIVPSVSQEGSCDFDLILLCQQALRQPPDWKDPGLKLARA